MKKKLQNQKLLLQAIRMSFQQIFIGILLCGITHAYAALGQDVLNKPVSINVESIEMKKILNLIGKQADVKFVYSSSTINTSQKITYKSNNKKLETVLNELLLPLSVSYNVSEGRILLKRVVEGTSFISNPITVPVENNKTIEQVVTGLVTDENGQELPGVSVVLKGSMTGAITNPQGRYSISVPDEKAVLTFSFVGFETQEVTVGSKTIINLKLLSDIKALSEVVVVGYGTQKKSDIISSVVTIKPDKMTKMVTLDAGEMLRGKAAGVLVTTSDAGPGGSSNIQIRGKSSINGGSSPIVIADGIPVGSINDINPADIASVEILKDAAAQAIYGARASNGVILITTKRGKSGTINVNYDSYIGTQNAKRNFEVYNGAEFAQLKREADRAVNKGVLRDDKLIFSADELQAIAEGRSIDWTKEILKNATIQNHNLSFSAGNEKTKLYVGGNYQDMDGIVPTTNIKKGTIRLNLDQYLTKWLKAGVNTSFQYGVSNDPDVAFQIRQVITASPLGNIYNPDGTFNVRPGGNQESFNPLLDLNEISTKKFNRNDILNVFLDINPIKNLNFRINASRRSWNYKQLSYSTRNSASGYSNSAGSGSINFQENAQWQLENILTYNFSVNKNHFNFTGVGSVNENNYYSFNNASALVPNDILGIYGLSFALKNTPTIGGNQRRLVSGVGRVQYDFDNKYYLTLSARADGSSVFGANNKWGYFPAVALGWNIHQEKFLQNLVSLDNLKLRLSYGSVGNEAIAPYGSLSLANQLDYLYGTEQVSGFAPGSFLSNPNLRWETSTTLNGAIDFAFWKNRVSGTIEAYKTSTTDLLVNRQLNSSIGYSTMRDNIGEVQNKGLELSLDVIPIETKDFILKTGMVFSTNRNKIISLYGDLNDDGIQDDDVANRWFVGKPIEVFYQPKFLGIWQAKDVVDGKIDPNTKKLAVPGDVILEDVNNDGKIDIQDNYITSKYHDWMGSFNLTATYKSFDFSTDIYTVQGITRDNLYLYDYTYGGDLRGNRNGIKVDYWTPENPSNTYPRPNAGTSPVGMTNLGLSDASYWRLQNISLGYSFPETLLTKAKLSKLRVYVTGQNLLTVTKYQSYSPEQDLSAYPTTRSFIGGLQLGF
jgi:TonB-dependent starch-binding outer membrane protein SusC